VYQDRAAPLTRIVWAIALLKLALHALTSAQGYGYFGDELYYLACARRLDWGYVDQPPLSVALLTAWTGVFGESLASIRMVPALFGAAAVVLAGQLARELGGRAQAQVLTALIVALAPVNLVVQGYYSMNAIDIVVWLAGFVLIARLVRAPTPGRWLWLGVLLGLGLLDKYSVLWLGAGLGVGLLATPHRRLLATPWPWIAAALALALFLPHLVWQWRHDFPTAEFIAAATAGKMVRVGPIDLFGQQLLVMHPLAAPIWIAGFFLLLRSPSQGAGRIFAAVFVTTTLILVVNGTSRPNYLALAQPPLVAAGAVGLERWATGGRWRWAPAAAIALIGIAGLVMSVMTVPVLPPAALAQLRREIGVSAPKMEKRDVGALDPHFADMIGWDAIVAAVADVWDALPEADRDRATIVASNYSEAGAIEQLGRARGLPVPVSPHNSYWTWGPGPADHTVFVILAHDAGAWRDAFESVEAAGTWDCGFCLPGRNHETIFVARDPTRPLDDLWLELRRYE
jgi:4-amino-4-deoxy-L-arabinose transferase-like glycosyltransferase